MPRGRARAPAARRVREPPSAPPRRPRTMRFSSTPPLESSRLLKVTKLRPAHTGLRLADQPGQLPGVDVRIVAVAVVEHHVGLVGVLGQPPDVAGPRRQFVAVVAV